MASIANLMARRMEKYGKSDQLMESKIQRKIGSSGVSDFIILPQALDVDNCDTKPTKKKAIRVSCQKREPCPEVSKVGVPPEKIIIRKLKSTTSRIVARPRKLFLVN